MYLSVTKLAKVVLTKAVFLILGLQVHTHRMWLTRRIFFPITSSNLSGTLLLSEKVKGHVKSFSVSRVNKACSHFDFTKVIGNDRNFEENKNFLY